MKPSAIDPGRLKMLPPPKFANCSGMSPLSMSSRNWTPNWE